MFAILKKKRSWLFVIAYLALIILAVLLTFMLGSPQKTRVQKVGFITPGSFSDPGWNARHFNGIREACRATGVELLVRDNIAEFSGACPQAVSELVAEGAEMIILSAAGYSTEMASSFNEYEQVSFYGIFSDLDIPNLTGYSARMYQVRYLTGIIAGEQTENGKIGFVATTASHEVYRAINAFTLGVRRVRPDAAVFLTLTGSSSNPVRDAAAAEKLIHEAGVDVITHHQNQYTVIDVAEKAGIASIGYYEHAANLSDRFLTCATCEWEIIYQELLREYLNGRNSSIMHDWLGLDSGVIRLTKYSPLVSQAAADEVERARQEILSGLDVFINEIRDNQGNLRCGSGEALSDETLTQQIDWLVEGVRLYE